MKILDENIALRICSDCEELIIICNLDKEYECIYEETSDSMDTRLSCLDVKCCYGKYKCKNDKCIKYIKLENE